MELPIITLLSGTAVLAAVVALLVTASGFCQASALYDWVILNNRTRLNSWLIIACCAALVVGACELLAGLAFAEASGRSRSLPAGRLVIGGLLFGIGMGLVRSCPTRLIIRAGRGQLSGILGLVVISLCSYTLYYNAGWLTALSPLAIELPVSQDAAVLIAWLAGGLDTTITRSALMVVILIVLTIALRRSRQLVEAKSPLAIGIAVGCVWALAASSTGDQAREAAQWLDEPHQGLEARGLSLIGPLRAFADWLLSGGTFSRATSGVAMVVGMLAGSSLYQLRYSWRLQNDLRYLPIGRQLIGYLLLGSGGFIALGCSMGQGISGLAILSLGSLITATMMVAGAVLVYRIELTFHNHQPLIRAFLPWYRLR